MKKFGVVYNNLIISFAELVLTLANRCGHDINLQMSVGRVRGLRNRFWVEVKICVFLKQTFDRVPPKKFRLMPNACDRRKFIEECEGIGRGRLTTPRLEPSKRFVMEFNRKRIASDGTIAVDGVTWSYDAAEFGGMR